MIYTFYNWTTVSNTLASHVRRMPTLSHRSATGAVLSSSSTPHKSTPHYILYTTQEHTMLYFTNYTGTLDTRWYNHTGTHHTTFYKALLSTPHYILQTTHEHSTLYVTKHSFNPFD